MEWRIRSSSRHGDIQLGATLKIHLISAAKMTPFWDPNFTPLCGQLAAPPLYAHREPGPNFTLYTPIQVLGPASYPVSHWPRPGWASDA